MIFGLGWVILRSYQGVLDLLDAFLFVEGLEVEVKWIDIIVYNIFLPIYLIV